MDVSHKVNQLEDEIKILKKEVQTVLLDIRENLLNRENPFVAPQTPTTNNYMSQNTVSEPEQPVELPPLPPPPPAPVEEIIEEPVIPEEPVSFEDDSDENEADIFNDNHNGNGHNHSEDLVETIEVVQKVNPAVVFDSPKTETEVLVNGWMPAESEEEHNVSNGNGHINENVNIDKNGNGNGKKPEILLKANKDKEVKEEKETDGLSVSLETISGFIDWVEKSVKRLGPDKTGAMLEIAATMKYLSPEMKKILMKFVTVNEEEKREEIAFQDYIASLVELAHLLGKDNDSDNVLFYTLYQGLYTTSEVRKIG
jgi:hypothetical protein